MFKGRKYVLWLSLLVLLVGAFWLGNLQGRRVPPGANVVQDIRIETEAKSESGAIYGDFVVVVDLLNPNPDDLKQLRVICQQLSSPREGPIGGEPTVVNKQLTVANLPAGERVALRFPGFSVQQPGEKQEIVVVVVGQNGLGKYPYSTTTPPESGS